MGHLCGNGICQSQAAAWWDIVVRVNAAEHGKATRGALFRYDSVVCWDLWGNGIMLWQTLP